METGGGNHSSTSTDTASLPTKVASSATCRGVRAAQERVIGGEVATARQPQPTLHRCLVNMPHLSDQQQPGGTRRV